MNFRPTDNSESSWPRLGYRRPWEDLVPQRIVSGDAAGKHLEKRFRKSQAGSLTQCFMDKFELRISLFNIFQYWTMKSIRIDCWLGITHCILPTGTCLQRLATYYHSKFDRCKQMISFLETTTATVDSKNSSFCLKIVWWLLYCFNYVNLFTSSSSWALHINLQCNYNVSISFYFFAALFHWELL